MVDVVPLRTGRVHQVNVSDGGVPKRPMAGPLPLPPAYEVGERGIVGDRQANRKYHGKPWQALCLWSLELIEALQAEGHPIDAGDAGENLTVAGLDWASVVPGVRLRIGEHVLAEITDYTVPCHKIAGLFDGRRIRRIDQAHNPGWSRVYASVLEVGVVRPGDPVTFADT